MLNTLQLATPQTQRGETAGSRAQTAANGAPPGIGKGAGAAASSKILRFYKSERIVHWAIAGPFLVSFASAMILVLVYNPDPSRPYRTIFAGLHRTSGVALIVLPMLATLKCRRDVWIHLYNIKQAWTWVYDDFKWLALMGLAAVDSKIKLPEQGKFNAAEKLNFMVLLTTYPLYVATGLLMWLTHLAILSWIMHFLMAMLAAPLLSGHLFMAMINRASRPGLEGMISGFVDRHWAKHHYRRWYREHHEAAEKQQLGESHEGPCSAIAPAARGSVDPAVVSPFAVRQSVTVSSMEGSGTAPEEQGAGSKKPEHVQIDRLKLRARTDLRIAGRTEASQMCPDC